MKTAILGWGSLIWDARPDFDSQIGSWHKGGPKLSIEFCRVSKSRKGALTLVIDPKLGTEVETLYTVSLRANLQDAICDLRSREGTTLEKIGFVELSTTQQRGRCAESIRQWAGQLEIDAVVWTDLESNFLKEKKAEFTFESALGHLKSLDFASLREAIRYIARAPAQIDTGFRQRANNDEWFRQQVALLHEDA